MTELLQSGKSFRIFLTLGKILSFIDQLKQLLSTIAKKLISVKMKELR